MGVPWPQLRCRLFYLFVFLLPWQTRWIVTDPTVSGGVWEYGRVSLYGWDILLAALVLLSAPQLWRELRQLTASSRAFRLYLALTSWALLTSAWAPLPWLGAYWGVRLAEAGALWLLVRVVKPKLEHIVLAIIAAATLQAAWGLAQFVAQATFSSKWLGVAAHPLTQAGTSVVLADGGRWLRAYAGQVHPNVLGGLLAVSSLATAWLYVTWSRARRAGGRWWLLGAYLIQLGGLFVAFSRAAWLALAVSLIAGCFAWGRGARARSAAVVALAVAVFITLGAVFWGPTRARLTGPSASRLERQAIEERVTGVREGGSMLRAAWWRGVGVGNYTAALFQVEPGRPAWHYQPTHNLFLLIAAELGLLGLGLYLWFLYQRLRHYQRHLILLAPLLATSLFDHYWWTIPSMALLFWLLLAMPETEAGP